MDRGAMVAACLVVLSSSVYGQIGGLNSASLPTRSEVSQAPPDTRVHSQPSTKSDVFGARPGTYRPNRFTRPRPAWSYGDIDESYGYVEELRKPVVEEKGHLALDLKPGSAEVYIDGGYAGTVGDLRRLIPGRSLDAGSHRIELRAPGFDTLTFDVRIFPRETTTYRRDLDPAAPPAVPGAEAPRPSRTFYVIPGCYAGDRPPVASQLRRACDSAKLRAIPPVFQARR